MSGETIRLADYAAKLTYEDLPPAVVQRAKDTIIDTVASIYYGHALPWSKIIVSYAERTGAGGKSRILGSPGPTVHPNAAALANGSLAHAFELDSLTKPGTGCHPGAALVVPALAIAQSEDRAFSGRDLITAVVAGAEVLIRIGHATQHTNEKRGFHAPGTTGPFGGAVAAGRLLGFKTELIANALGIAGSLSSGLLEFARFGSGAMVKRLHIGRAAESGVLAATLARDGFEGPVTVLEGAAGFLKVFCDKPDIDRLVCGLGREYETLTTLIKQYACHITAQTPVQAFEELRAALRFEAGDIERITIAGIERMVRVNNIPKPADRMMAQYSAPFCVALSMFRDLRDPDVFDEEVVKNEKVLDLVSRIDMVVDEGKEAYGSLASTVTVYLKDGRHEKRRIEEFAGTPANPLDRDGLRRKFLFLARGYVGSEALYERLQGLEDESDVRWIGGGQH
jgi:2-methylcitrate dehydratase PrpD